MFSSQPAEREENRCTFQVGEAGEMYPGQAIRALRPMQKMTCMSSYDAFGPWHVVPGQ
jgi:hypothetical protein